MPGLSRRLKQLEKELLALGEKTMLIEELDGFIAGLLVCPDLIKPSEWLPIIWGRDDGEPQAAFDNLDHVNRVLGLIMEDYNGVARPRSPPITDRHFHWAAHVLYRPRGNESPRSPIG